MTLDRSAFLKPIAHRGLHDGKKLLENTAPAFSAALQKGYGIECDLQPAADGTPFVFHDFTLERLVEAKGAIRSKPPASLKALKYRDREIGMLTFAEFLELAGGRGPLLVEIKSDFGRPVPGFLENVASLARRYKGPLALMSFDPDVMATLALLAPSVSRGIVSGVYEGREWKVDKIGKPRAARLTDLLDSRPAAVAFYAYHVKALPRPVVQYAREVQGLPIFAWTVRSASDRKTAEQYADAPIFEGYVP